MTSKENIETERINDYKFMFSDFWFLYSNFLQNVNINKEYLNLIYGIHVNINYEYINLIYGTLIINNIIYKNKKLNSLMIKTNKDNDS